MADIKTMAEIKAKIDNYFQHWTEPDRPGGVVVVIKDGDVVHNASYGLANLETKEPVNSGQIFALASVTKQFTGTCVLLLEEEGVLDLDADVHTYIPELGDYGTKITVRDLCHHTSGIREYLHLAQLAGGELLRGLNHTNMKEIICGQKSLQFSPGTRMAYSNSNYIILTWIIERLTGKSFGDILKSRIFNPLGMKNSSLGKYSTNFIPNGVIGYTGDAENGFAQKQCEFVASGEGGILSTMDDMIQWELNFENNRIGSPGLMDRLVETTPLKCGSPNEYGFGLSAAHYRDHLYQRHDGGMPGFSTTRTRYPEQRLSIIILANYTDDFVYYAPFELADYFLPAKKPQTQPTKKDKESHDPVPKELAGCYQDVQSGLNICLAVQDGHLSADIMGNNILMEPAGSQAFKAAPGVPLPVRIEFPKAGEYQKALLDGGTGYQYPVEKVSEEDTPLDEFIGDYGSMELGSTLTVLLKDQVLWGCLKGTMGEKDLGQLRRLGRDCFVLDDPEIMSLSLYFEKGDTGDIKDLIVMIDQVEGNRFIKNK